MPAAAQEQANLAAGLCQSMGPTAVMAISGGILLGVVLLLALIYWRLQHGGWSLANAASEPTTLRIPLDENWALSLGDRKSLLGAGAPKGPVVSLTVMEASSSRLIALAGMVAILFLFVGFGIFSLYTYGLTCQMPASTVAVSTFLYSGLTLFAPYVANKVSGLLQPLRAPSPWPASPSRCRRASRSPHPCPSPCPSSPRCPPRRGPKLSPRAEGWHGLQGAQFPIGSQRRSANPPQRRWRSPLHHGPWRRPTPEKPPPTKRQCS